MRPERSASPNENASRRSSRGSSLGHVALDPVDRLQLRLRLARLGGLVTEALDEALHARDLRLAAGDIAPGGELARGLLGAPGVPRTLEVARAPRLELEHRGADRLEKPAVVSDQDHGRVEADQVVLEPLERLDVEVVGGLVEQQQVGPRGEHPRERGSGQLTAREAAERAVELVVAEAEAVEGRLDAVAPAISAGRLQAGLSVRVGVRASPRRRRRRPSAARGARGRPRSPRSSRARRSRTRAASTPARGGRWSCSATRTPLPVASVPASIPASPESIRSSVVLPLPLRPDSVIRSPAVELEGEVGEQRPPTDVFCQPGGCDHGHRQVSRRSARVRRSAAACSAASSLTWKDEPQPQAATTFGLLTVNPAPWRPST